jgi:peptide/nickel transport system ATP-binding protein
MTAQEQPRQTDVPNEARPAPVFTVRDLHVQFRNATDLAHVVRGVSYEVRPGEIVAIVGESGSGKSVSSLAAMRLITAGHSVRYSGSVAIEGQEILTLSEARMRRLRGRHIAMVFQDPMTSLNPLLTIGRQITEGMLEHLDISKSEADRRAIELLTQVGVTDPERRMRQYPHEFSGGMRQRVVIAIALSCDPAVIIADEPTTALDVTIQAQILDLLRKLATDRNVALVLITHNLGLVARYADRVNVMYAGEIVESGATAQVLSDPRHRYTQGLLSAVPSLSGPLTAELRTIPGQPLRPKAKVVGCPFAPRCAAATDVCSVAPTITQDATLRRYACHHPHLGGEEAAVAKAAARSSDFSQHALSELAPILTVKNLVKHFSIRNVGTVRAVDDISFTVPDGGTLGLVGESGCGKSSVARTLLRLQLATSGQAMFRGTNILTASRTEIMALRRKIQVIYQDPYSSLNPRHRVGTILGEPLLVHGLRPDRVAAADRVQELLALVGLPPDAVDRYPHEMSGGQRQRVGIARALGMEPELIICDEPVSALDVSIQAQVINLLTDLQQRLKLSYLFIAHDLAVVRHISDLIAVMYLGKIVETGTRDEVFGSPRHPYTKSLLSAVPSLDDLHGNQDRPLPLAGEVPSPLSPPSGCVFRTRCPIAAPECAQAMPSPRWFSPTHTASCIKVQ